MSGSPRRAVAVLVVATPCPLILAAPIAFISGVSRAARDGVIVKGGAVIEALGRARTVLFDKTGTLTLGTAEVDRIVTAGRPPRRRGAADRGLAGPVLVARHGRRARAGGLRPRAPAQHAERRPRGPRAGDRRGRRRPPRRRRQHGVRRGRAAHGAGIPVGGLRRSRTGARHGGCRRPRRRGDHHVGPPPRGRVRGSSPTCADRASGTWPSPRATSRARPRPSGAPRASTASTPRQSPQDKLELVRTLAAQRGPRAYRDGRRRDQRRAGACACGRRHRARRGRRHVASEAADAVIAVDRIDRVARAVAIGRRSIRIARQSVIAGLGLSIIGMGVRGRRIPAARGGCDLPGGHRRGRHPERAASPGRRRLVTSICAASTPLA